MRHYTSAPPARMWRQGAKVLGNKDLLPGTVIANFEHGRWHGPKQGGPCRLLPWTSIGRNFHRRPVPWFGEGENFDSLHSKAAPES
ncbi:BPSL0067 family protein [Pseudoduganella sp. FT26W]|uniref:BPSL0067 family protein n=1 Tax=Duganella aquatilis TaxID=2666082 RepID=A0A844DAU4_9BURK|nr:BPSL0067 family protein [Duganella aquatilis]